MKKGFILANLKSPRPMGEGVRRTGKGFTLAEVLITMGIIGIVAAITLPTLIANHQKKVLKTQFSKVYNVLYNAIRKTYVDNGESYYECYYVTRNGMVIGGGSGPSVECPQFYEAFKKSLNVVKECKDHALANGCISADMKGNDKVHKENNPEMTDEEIEEALRGALGYSDTNIKNYNPTLVLNDGTVIGMYSQVNTRMFWVDINGHKKPNKWGHDIFSFDIRRDLDNNKFYIQDGGGANPEKGGVTTTTMINSLYK